MNNNYLIYRIEFPNNKSYIGLTSNFKKRRLKHRFDSFSNKPTAQKYAVHRAIVKYGFENIKWEVLENSLSKGQAKEREIYYIQVFNSFNKDFGYNLTRGGDFISNQKYTDEDILENAKKYKTVRDWRNDKGNSLYSTAKMRSGELFKKCKEHMIQARFANEENKRSVSNSSLIEEARKYKNSSEFRSKNEAWYYLASKRNLLGYIEFPESMRKHRSYEEILLEASKYRTMKEWKSNSSVTVSYARRLGWYEDIKKELGFKKHKPRVLS